VLGKLGDLLNKDVGAGKMLNADLGDLLRSAPAAETAAPAATNAAATASPSAAGTPPAASVSAPAAPAPIEDKFDPDATLQLRRPPPLAAASATGAAATADPAATPRLTDELVTRSKRQVPQGTSLMNLLPHTVGEFERPHAAPAGELTSDPVTAIYRGGGDTIAVKLMQCWDNDEAIERLQDIKAQSGENVRVANDHSWVLGQTAQGIVFAWNRDTYSFSATSPKGLGSLAKFLGVFPY